MIRFILCRVLGWHSWRREIIRIGGPVYRCRRLPCKATKGTYEVI